MPPQLRVEETVPVHVELSPTAMQRAASATSASDAIDPETVDPQRPLTVQLMARSNVEVVGEDRIDAAIPVAGDQPVSLFFDVKGTGAGEGELWVVVRQGQPSLLLLKLTPRVVADGASRPRVPLCADGAVPAAAPAGWSLPTLRINERATADSVTFEYDLDLQERGTFRGLLLDGSRDAFVRSIYDDLEQRWLASNEDEQAFLRDVRGYGGTLWDRLLPSELQRLLWRYRRDLKHIRVLSTEPSIPWELVHLKSPQTGRLPRETMFLAQMGLVRWLFDGPGAAQGLRCRPGKVRYVIPDYPDRRFQLAKPAVERAFLERTFGATAVQPHQGPVVNLLSRPGAFDLLHFAGHGAAGGVGAADAKLPSRAASCRTRRRGSDPYLRARACTAPPRCPGTSPPPSSTISSSTSRFSRPAGGTNQPGEAIAAAARSRGQAANPTASIPAGASTTASPSARPPAIPPTRPSRRSTTSPRS